MGYRTSSGGVGAARPPRCSTDEAAAISAAAVPPPVAAARRLSARQRLHRGPSLTAQTPIAWPWCLTASRCVAGHSLAKMQSQPRDGEACEAAFCAPIVHTACEHKLQRHILAASYRAVPLACASTGSKCHVRLSMVSHCPQAAPPHCPDTPHVLCVCSHRLGCRPRRPAAACWRWGRTS